MFASLVMSGAMTSTVDFSKVVGIKSTGEENRSYQPCDLDNGHLRQPVQQGRVVSVGWLTVIHRRGGLYVMKNYLAG